MTDKLPIYLKGLLVGTMAFLLSVGLVSVLTLAIMWQTPSSWHSLGWGSFMELDFPDWPALLTGILAFIVGFRWMLRTGSIENSK